MSNLLPYVPAPHLIAISGLTAEELVSHFQDFSNSLRYVSTAPELVFERLVEHLIGSVKTRIEDGWQDDYSTIQESQHANERTTAEMQGLSSDFDVSQHTKESLIVKLQEISSDLYASQRANECLIAKKEELSSELHASWLTNENLAAELQEKCRALQQCQADKNALHASQLANKTLTDELAKLKLTIPAIAPSKINTVKDVAETNPTIGTFNTYESGSSSKLVSFANKYTMVPGLVVGLTLLDVDAAANVRVNAYPNEIQREHFKINVSSWNDTRLYGAACAWLAIKADDMDFQYGSYHTIEDHDWRETPHHNTRKITFKRQYPAAPKVVVWLNVIDLGCRENFRIKTFATDVTTTGFIIHIDTWSDTRLYSAMASWVAYPTVRSGVASGSFSTMDIRSSGQEQVYNSAYESFGKGVFEKPPRLFLALNALDIDRRATMRVMVKADNVSAAGMTWHLDSWRDSSMYSAGASYIALR